MSLAAKLDGYLTYFKATSNEYHREMLLARLKQEEPKTYAALIKLLKGKS